MGSTESPFPLAGAATGPVLGFPLSSKLWVSLQAVVHSIYPYLGAYFFLIPENEVLHLSGPATGSVLDFPFSRKTLWSFSGTRIFRYKLCFVLCPLMLVRLLEAMGVSRVFGLATVKALT